MYAIVEIAGLQYKVERPTLVCKPLGLPKGKKVKFDRVLLTEEGDVKVGAPVIDGAVVEATVNGEVKVIKFLYSEEASQRVPENEWSPPNVHFNYY